VTLMSE